jgi:myosin-5
MATSLSSEISKTDSESKRMLVIGVLDIFGFEIFKINSFEQLCINYANEKLQQQFNAHTFKTEEAEYKLQEVEYEAVTYIDNQDVLDLIECKKPPGIFALMEDEIYMPRATDLTLLQKNDEVVHGRHSLRTVPQ